MEKTIYIIRHGETELNKNRIIQGSGIDSSLNDTGRQQADAFFHQYANIGFDVVLTSGLKRTHETVAPFINEGLPWEQFVEINEMSWGIYEGKSSTPDMKIDYDAMLTAWKVGDYSARIPEGESAQELADRLLIFINHLKERPEEKILVCSHGRAMRCMMALLENKPLSDMDQFHHSNTGLYLVDYSPDQFVLKIKNDISHLTSLVS